MGVSLLLASAAAGCFSRCFVHPMDTLRTRLMASAGATTLRAAFRQIAARDGPRGFYRGFAVSVALQAPAVATYLTTYDVAKAASPLPPHAPATHLAAGLAAEAVSAVFWVPMEVVKQRAQLRSGPAGATAAVVRDLLRAEGPAALFRGYGLTLGVFGPYAMVYFVAYERFKKMAGKRDARPLPTPVVAACASAAGAIAGGITTPLDVIKTRIQTQGDVATRQGGLVRPRAYRGTWHAVRVIAAEEGLRGFAKGLWARVLWIMPGTAITFSTFEFLKQYFDLKP